MPLILQENFTVKLLESLRQGEIDVAILADPFSDAGLVTQAVYDEPFIVAVPKKHPWSRRKRIPSPELHEQTMLLLGTGHCFRDHVLEVCPELSRYSQATGGIQKTFEGSSLETIRHMVASGIGITVLPRTAVPERRADSLLATFPSSRRRRCDGCRWSGARAIRGTPAIDALREAILGRSRRCPEAAAGRPIAH